VIFVRYLIGFLDVRIGCAMVVFLEFLKGGVADFEVKFRSKISPSASLI